MRWSCTSDYHLVHISYCSPTHIYFKRSDKIYYCLSREDKDGSSLYCISDYFEKCVLTSADCISKRLYMIRTDDKISYLANGANYFCTNLWPDEKIDSFQVIGLMVSPRTPHLYISYRENGSTIVTTVEDLSRLIGKDESVIKHAK